MSSQSFLPFDSGKAESDMDSVFLVSPPMLKLHDDLLWSIFSWNANMAEDHYEMCQKRASFFLNRGDPRIDLSKFTSVSEMASDSPSCVFVMGERVRF